MADHVLESRLHVPRPRAEVFAFFADPAHPARVTPPWCRFTLLTASPAPMSAGAVYDYRLRCAGLPFRWRAFIREYDPPYRFVDVQVRGPCVRWEHRHLFLADGGGTWIEDRLTYRWPLGMLGEAGDALIMGRLMSALWAYRQRRIEESFGTAN